MATETVRIRRYPNRRFYDRTGRCYVTLQDIESMVCEGRTVEVEDSKTGEDLTRQVLTQILLERHPEKMDLLFPASVLHSVLQSNDLVMDFWRSCLRQSLEALQGWQKRGMGSASPLGWMSAFFPFSGFGAGVSATGGVATAGEGHVLSDRIAEIEGRINRLEAGETAEVVDKAQKKGKKLAAARGEEADVGSSEPSGVEQLEGLEQRLTSLERPRRRSR